MNKIIILGRACRDARIRKTIVKGKDELIATFPIMEVKPTKKENQASRRIYHCICSGKTADYAGLHVKENSLVYVQGSMGMFNKTNTRDGSKLRVNTVPVNWLTVYGQEQRPEIGDNQEINEEIEAGFWKISNVAIISGIVKDPVRIMQSEDGTVWAYMLINNVRKTVTRMANSYNHSIRVIAFGKSAYHLYKNYCKGDSVLVYGTAHLNVYTNEDGNWQEGWEVIMEHVEKTLPIEESRGYNVQK